LSESQTIKEAMAFKNIVGNEKAKTLLRRYLELKKMPNSMLFWGPEGVGKMSLAKEVAKAINCKKLQEDACDSCSSCRAVMNENHPDIMFIYPKGNMLKIEQMRMLKQIAYFKPMIGKKRVFIIDDAEKMNEEAANSLLKTLEEPPAFTHVILITTNPFLILPTIKSRCQIVRLSPLSSEEIEKVLIEKGYQRERARIISLLSRGNLKEALTLDWDEINTIRGEAWRLFISLITGQGVGQRLENYYSQNLSRGEWEQLLEMIASFCRDLILIKERGEERLLLNPDFLEEIRRVEAEANIERCLDYLPKIDFTLYGFNKNLNLNLLTASFFANFSGETHA